MNNFQIDDFCDKEDYKLQTAMLDYEIFKNNEEKRKTLKRKVEEIEEELEKLEAYFLKSDTIFSMDRGTKLTKWDIEQAQKERPLSNREIQDLWDFMQIIDEHDSILEILLYLS